MDLTGDCNVTFEDIDALAAEWLNDCNVSDEWCYGADIDQNGTVNLSDFAIMAGQWLTTDPCWSNNANCKVITPEDNLVATYNWLKSSSCDGWMGALSATNRRTLILAPGTYTLASTFVPDTNYVDVVGLTNESEIVVNTGNLACDISFGLYTAAARNIDVKISGLTAINSAGETFVYPRDTSFLRLNKDSIIQQTIPTPTYIDTFTYTDWTVTSGATLAQDVNYVMYGTESMSDTRAAAGYASISRTLAEPNDFRAHVFFLRYWIDPNLADYLTNTAISFNLFQDIDTDSNHFCINRLPSSPGWNEITMCPSMGSYSGTMTDLSSVIKVRISVAVPAEGVHIVWDAFIAIPTGRTKAAVIIGFDDSIQTQWTEGIRYLHKYNFPCNWFISAEQVTEPGQTRKNSPTLGDFAQWDEIANAVSCGAVLGGHSLSDMPKNNETALRRWCEMQKWYLVSHGYSVNTMAIPGGQVRLDGTLTEQQVYNITKDYFKFVRGTAPYWQNAARGETFVGYGAYAMPYIRMDSRWGYGAALTTAANVQLYLNKCIADKDVFSWYVHAIDDTKGMTVAEFQMAVDYIKSQVDAGVLEVITYEDLIK